MRPPSLSPPSAIAFRNMREKNRPHVSDCASAKLLGSGDECRKRGGLQPERPDEFPHKGANREYLFGTRQVVICQLASATVCSFQAQI